MPNVNIEPEITSASVEEGPNGEKVIKLTMNYTGIVSLDGKFTVGNTLKMELPSKPQP